MSVVGGGTSRKLLRIVDRITQSKYFQQATEYKYIKRAMEGVSNTRLELRVELKSMIGALAINIPPPPTDRLWSVPLHLLCSSHSSIISAKKNSVSLNKCHKEANVLASC